ncbi:MAG: antibiotic biosynthesis monooxygenase [Gammaproteobacteria bacterium]|nr:antibiotic biosynthesis monooxygenase [Gammaproteobacteria bacterium]MBT4493592.1 antibiotic biosynthesis monooxygenase [Gammaproteobacteria bacterium]MBT7371103.1 antibiotic biosynthesis monooxygenase [Gammaproteobacteria bacterium]
MAIGIVAKLKIQEGKNEEFEAIFNEMASAVTAQEPGNNFYALHRSREDSSIYVVLEQYADQAALDVHGKSDEFTAAAAKLGGCLGGKPEIEFLDGV